MEISKTLNEHTRIVGCVGISWPICGQEVDAVYGKDSTLFECCGRILKVDIQNLNVDLKVQTMEFERASIRVYRNKWGILRVIPKQRLFCFKDFCEMAYVNYSLNNDSLKIFSIPDLKGGEESVSFADFDYLMGFGLDPRLRKFLQGVCDDMDFVPKDGFWVHINGNRWNRQKYTKQQAIQANKNLKEKGSDMCHHCVNLRNESFVWKIKR